MPESVLAVLTRRYRGRSVGFGVIGKLEGIPAGAQRFEVDR